MHCLNIPAALAGSTCVNKMVSAGVQWTARLKPWDFGRLYTDAMD